MVGSILSLSEVSEFLFGSQMLETAKQGYGKMTKAKKKKKPIENNAVMNKW